MNQREIESHINDRDSRPAIFALLPSPHTYMDSLPLLEWDVLPLHVVHT